MEKDNFYAVFRFCVLSSYISSFFFLFVRLSYFRGYGMMWPRCAALRCVLCDVVLSLRT
jgi:hypothetical protein